MKAVLWEMKTLPSRRMNKGNVSAFFSLNRSIDSAVIALLPKTQFEAYPKLAK